MHLDLKFDLTFHKFMRHRRDGRNNILDPGKI